MADKQAKVFGEDDQQPLTSNYGEEIPLQDVKKPARKKISIIPH